MFEFTRTEYEEICQECMLNEEYKKLFEMFMVEHNNIGNMFKEE